VKHSPYRSQCAVDIRGRAGELECLHHVTRDLIQSHAHDVRCLQEPPAIAVIGSCLGFQSDGLKKQIEAGKYPGVVKTTLDGVNNAPFLQGQSEHSAHDYFFCYSGAQLAAVGWGTAVSTDKVWITGLNGKILVMDFNGRPIGKESDFPFADKVGGLQGVGVAANGDVWIADATKNQLLYFPGGRVKDGRLVQVAGLKSPFGIAIDSQNRVWVSNAQSDTVVRFPANDPTKAESLRAGIGVRGVALDSKGNLWVASNMSLVGIELRRADVKVKGYQSRPFGCEVGSQFHQRHVS
jgi:hypothetical protein